MNFFLDHDVPADVGRVLRLKGHGVQILQEALASTTDDLSALRHAVSHGLVVITCNRRDFCVSPRPNRTLASSSWSDADHASPNVPRCFD